VWDRNAIRNNSYTQCEYDCLARNVSNIGRLHPQVAACCSVLQRVPLFGSVLQCAAV